MEKRDRPTQKKSTLSRTRIRDIKESMIGSPMTVCGWVRTVRDQKQFSFVEISDGSTVSNLQIIAESSLPDYPKLLQKLTVGSSVQATGTLVASPGGKQKWELKATSIDVLGTCPADYPLQKKRHSFEFLRTIAHLRPRTNTQGAVLRVRSRISQATHTFFQQRGFLYVHTPIITASDCEGGGEQFRVTTLTPQPNKQVDWSSDFFHKPTYLTVSGQLNGEALACALSDIYTFGPTFRAENSNTSRHLAEFWMIEPEMAFATLEDDIECAEAYIKYLITDLLNHCAPEVEFFDSLIEPGLTSRLSQVARSEFAQITYTEAVSILQKSGESFAFPVSWGIDLQSEHERFLAEKHFQKPVFITDYPAAIKAFYMKENPDGKTVAAMDLLVPKIGEIIGGSQREDQIDILRSKMVQFQLNPEDYAWYLQLREYGSVPHAGFGAGLERLIQFVTGMENIRDVIPFPRYPGHAEF